MSSRELSLVGSRPSSRLPIVSAAADASAFADAMSELAGGVVLVTCRVDGRPWGMTVTTFQSVSAEPPTVLVSLASVSRAAKAVAGSGRFGVNVLPATHVAVARYAAKAGAPKYLERFAVPGAAVGPAPAVDGALARLDCEVSDHLKVADHTLFIARVLSARSSGEGPPLLYHRRDYRTLSTRGGRDARQ